MPIENKSYNCCICGQTWGSYEKAEECEKSHKIISRADKPEYSIKDRKSDYPLSVLVHFTDNSSARYYRK